MENYGDKINDIYSAIYMGDLQEVEKMTNYLNSSSSWRPEYKMLCMSLLLKHIAIARFFVEKNCEVDGDNKQNYKGNSALHSAVLYGDSSLVRLILERGALHNSTNLDGLMPLHLVVYRNPAISGILLPPEKVDEESSKIIDVLLEYGMNINAIVPSQHKFGYTCLHLAAECGNEKIVPLLLKKHANFNAKTGTGVSPLHVAVLNGSSGVLNLLLNKGASVYTKDRRGRTPLCWSIKLERLDIMESLLNFEAPPFRKNANNFPTLQDDNSSILTAVKMDKPSIVKSLLSKGANVNASWKDGTTALHIAVEIGSDDIVQLLLHHGADVTAVADSKKTALYYAIEREWIKIVEILLNYVPEINSVLAFPSACGITPLHLAISKGCEDIVKLLLKKGNSAIINPRSEEYPLHTAILKNRGKLLKLLLDNEFDVDVTDMHGKSALHIATYQGSLEMVQEICRVYSKREKKLKQGYEALCIAAMKGRMEILKLLLEEGADLNARPENHLTPLCAAAENGHFDILKFLLANGANVNEILSDGRSALHCAIQRGFLKITEYLLQSGANVNNYWDTGNSSLHFAAELGKLKIIQLLVSKGADVNAKNSNDATPLFIAVEQNFKNIVQYLINNGANVNIADKNSIIKSFNFTNDCIRDLKTSRGLRPLIVAVDNRNFEMVKILLKSGVSVHIQNERVSPLHLASANGSLEIVKELIKFGANMNSVCEQHYTAFSHAIANGKSKTFMYLLSQGVQLNTNSKNSELHIALSSARKDKKVVEILLDYGASVRTTNSNNQTALHCAISFGNSTDEEKLFRLLLDYGSDINARDKNGDTPIHIAAREEDFIAAEVLLEYETDIDAVNSEGKVALNYLVDMIQDDLSLYMYHCNIETLKYQAIAKLIVREIALREFAGKIVSNKNLELAKSRKMNMFYETCNEELSRMKCREVYKKVTVYEILTTNDSQLASYIGNESIVQNLRMINMDEEFLCYFSMLKYRIKMAEERRELIISSEDVLKSMLKLKLPNLVVHEIFSYLSSADFKNMARVFQHPGQLLFKYLNPSERCYDS